MTVSSIVSELKPPRFDPYKLDTTQTCHASNPKLPLSYALHATNASIYGLEKLKINQIKYINSIIHAYTKTRTEDFDCFLQQSQFKNPSYDIEQ